MWEGAPVAEPLTVFTEVTNTLAAPYTTGLQRLTRELILRLADPRFHDGAISSVPLRWCPRHQTFRRLTDDEWRLISEGAHGTSPRGRRWTDRLPATMDRTLRRVARQRWVRRARTAVQPDQLPAAHPDLEVGPWPPGAVFLDMEAAWHNPRSRAELLPERTAGGLTTAVVVPDVLPETHPEWFESTPAALFRSYLHAHLRTSTRFLCISKATEADLVGVAAAIGEHRRLNSTVISLGSDLPPSTSPPRALPGSLRGRRYLLTVGTIEPRKGHTTLLDAFDDIAPDIADLALVVVGRVGWHAGDVVTRLVKHPDAGGRVLWLDQVSDDLLATLYREAFVCVAPSLSEGFGVPVVEALAAGLPVVASSGGALPEAGGELADYFEPGDATGLAALLRRHATDDAWHRERRRAVAAYQPPTWDDTARQVVAALNGP